MAIPRCKTIICDVQALAQPDLETVDALARLALTLRRGGLELRLRNASRELRELLAFSGLVDALGVEPGREAEQREQRLGVEEEAELADPPG
jgi:hypothetical protein